MSTKNISCLESVNLKTYRLLIEDNSIDIELFNIIQEEIHKILGSDEYFIKLELYKKLITLMFEWSIATFSRDVATSIFNLIEQTKFEIEKINEQFFNSSQEKTDPIEEFINWVLEVEKFLGFSLDFEKTSVFYFLQATKKMKKYYDEQYSIMTKK